MGATVCAHSGSRTLEIEVATPSEVYLRLRRDYLPWARYGSIFVKALRLDRGESLAADIPVSDPTARTVDVPVGTRLVGAVELDERFPRLAETLKETDVAVFWAFRLRAADWTATAAAGAFVLPQAGSQPVDAQRRSCTEHSIVFSQDHTEERE